MIIIRNFSESPEQRRADDKTNMISAAGILGSIGGSLGYYGLKKRALKKTIDPKNLSNNPKLLTAKRNAKLLAAGGLALSSGYGYLMRKYHKKKYGKEEYNNVST